MKTMTRTMGGAAMASLVLTLLAASPTWARDATPVAVPVITVPAPPPPGQCGAYYNLVTSGARATVRECRSSGGTLIRVDGWVTDTDNDGQCAEVYASYNRSTPVDRSARACPQGEVEYFTFPYRAGNNAFIYLREFDV